MKKLFFVLLMVMLLGGLVVNACAKTSPATTSATAATQAPALTSAPTTASTQAPAVTSAPAPTTKPAATTATPKTGGTFNLLHNGGLATLGSVPEAGNLMMLRYTLPVFETLLRMNDNQQIIPWLADSWDISADSKAVTFHLHKGIKFSDGTDFNADAVKYNLQAMVAGNIRGSVVLKKVTSYEIIDPLTIRLNLSAFDSTLLIRLAETAIGQMGSPTALQKPTTPEKQAFDHMVGTGPFLLDSWQRDNFVKFKKNPNYWQPGKPYLDYLVLKNVADLTVEIMAFKAKEAQALENPDPVDAKQMGQEGYTIHQPALHFYHAWVTDGSNPKSPFANKLVRQALEYAVDKKTMCEGIGMGYYEPLYQAATKNAVWYDSTLAPREYNPSIARNLLSAAGYPNGFTTTIVSDVRVRKDTLVAVQTYLKAVGIIANLDIADVARASTLTMQGWQGILFPGFPTAGTFVGLLGRYGVTTDYVSYYRPDGWQAKWDAMVAEPNDAKRMELFKGLVKIMYDEANVSFYQADAPLMALQPNTVDGFELHAVLAADYYTPETIWLIK